MRGGRLLSATPHATTPSERGRAIARLFATGLLLTVTAAVIVPIGVVTLFQGRRLYSCIASRMSRAILAVYGVRIRILPAVRFPRAQVVYVSNHTSTLDIFVLAALGLPRTRFFLSGQLWRLPPLAMIAAMMGTFFTVSQDQQAKRRRIFQRAAAVLRRTGESVYLSPEGARITTGEMGRFNKGAFHLATALGAPIIPLYLQIPAHVDPGLSHDARPGTVTVHVLPAIDTSNWRVEDLAVNVTHVRQLFVAFHEAQRCM